MSPSTDLPSVGPERDRLVAEALGCDVVGACFDMGEGLVGRPGDRIAMLRYAQVDKCVCAAVAHFHDFAADRAHWGHSWHCLKLVSQSSTSNHAAYDALEAAVESGVIAGYAILRNMENQQPFQVEVWNKDNGVIERAAPHPRGRRVSRHHRGQEEGRMKRLICWAFGHRLTYAEGQDLTDRITVDWPVVWCGRCNPTGRPHA